MDEIGGGFSAGGVHAHVERSGFFVGEAAGGVVDLGGGDADVGEDGVDVGDIFSGEDGGDGGEVVVVKREVAGDFLEVDLGEGEVGGVEVDGDEFSGGSEAAEDFTGVSAEAEGAVEDGLARAWVEDAEEFGEEDGDVSGVAFFHGGFLTRRCEEAKRSGNNLK